MLSVFVHSLMVDFAARQVIRPSGPDETAGWPCLSLLANLFFISNLVIFYCLGFSQAKNFVFAKN